MSIQQSVNQAIGNVTDAATKAKAIGLVEEQNKINQAQIVQEATNEALGHVAPATKLAKQGKQVNKAIGTAENIIQNIQDEGDLSDPKVNKELANRQKALQMLKGKEAAVSQQRNEFVQRLQAFNAKLSAYNNALPKDQRLDLNKIYTAEQKRAINTISNDAEWDRFLEKKGVK